MNPAMKIAGAAVLVIAAVAGSVYLLGGGGGGVGSDPSLTTTPSAAATPAADETATPTPAPTPFDAFDLDAYGDWSNYASKIYGTHIGHPAGWTVSAATREWDFETDAANDLSEGADDFRSPAGDIRVSVWTVPVEAGTTLREWVGAYCELNTTPCDDLDGRLEEVLREIRDQHLAGALIEFEADVQAFMPSWAYDTDLDAIWTDPAPAEGGEIIVIASWRSAAESNSRELVDGFSLQLCPDPDCAESTP
jgi:hypothetical protein